MHSLVVIGPVTVWGCWLVGMVRELALSFCFVVADLSLTGGGTVFYLGYTIFTSFLFRYAISIVSSKAVARVKL